VAAPAPRLDFYFDFISSNAYLAWHRMPALRERFGIDVVPVPVLFAGLLEKYGQLGPAEVPPKALWTWRNNVRKAALLGIPLRPPRFHPFNPLLPLRVASLPMDPAERDALIGALFGAVWARGLHASDPDVVAAVATEIGLPGADLVAAAQTPDAKARLRTQTDDAIGAGVFGVPAMRVGDEVFWGYDDLPYLELVLAGQDPLPADEQGSLERPPASARRRPFRDGA
jgi:2-hydroxychromene-2-carboxylate isomerase